MHIKNNGLTKMLIYALLLGVLHASALSVSVDGQANDEFISEYLACTPANATMSISKKELSMIQLLRNYPELAGAGVSFIVGCSMYRIPMVKNLYEKRIFNSPITQGKVAQTVIDTVAQIAVRKYLNKEQSLKANTQDSAKYIANGLVEDSFNFIFSSKIIEEILIRNKGVSVRSAEALVKNTRCLRYAGNMLRIGGYLRRGYTIHASLKSVAQQPDNDEHQNTQSGSEEAPDRREVSKKDGISEPSRESERSAEYPK